MTVLHDTMLNSLSHAKELIGQAQESNSYTGIQATYYKANTTTILAYATLALRMIQLTLLESLTYMRKGSSLTGSHLSECKESYMFVRGTGLEATFKRFNLDYDSDYIKNSFFWLFSHAS